MSAQVFNKVDKLVPPPFVTVSVEDKESRRRIFQTWSKLSKFSLDEKTCTFSSEGELLQAFILRKGSQLRLEKAMMLSRRILTLVSRWKVNACWGDFCKFKDAFESDDAKLKPSKKKKSGKGQGKKSDHVKGSMQEIHLPSRQWANWVLYLILRDLLLLSKIKWESERAVGYWLGMISCSHHPGDSLIIVGILSRIWAVSSGMVEDYANEVYPSLCFISSLLCPTRADNWLEDIDFPNDLFTWLGKILGFPFQPAKIGNYDQFLRTEGIKGSSKIDRILGGVFSSSQDSHQDYKNLSDVPSTSSEIRDSNDNTADDEEDFGVPVSVQESETEMAKEKPNRRKKQKLNEQINKKVCLDEKWTKFFKNFKSKLSTEGGRQQLLVRIRKYKKKESNPEINARLVKLHKFVKRDDRDKLLLFIPKVKRYISKRLSNKPE